MISFHNNYIQKQNHRKLEIMTQHQDYRFVVTIVTILSIGLSTIQGYIIPSSSIMSAFVRYGINNEFQNHGSSRHLHATVGEQSAAFSTTTTTLQPGQPTELPDSLSDAAIRAAEATKSYYDITTAGSSAIPTRCRIDFDTSIGDETFTILKQSTEFMQQYVTALSYALLPQLLQQRQKELMAVIQAKAELQMLSTSSDVDKEQREDELVQLIANNGRNVTESTMNSDAPSNTVRIYFPDEGSAALAQRDWVSIVPPCVEFASCNGIQRSSKMKQTVVAQIFFCPRASDAEAVERILFRTEEDAMNDTERQQSLLTVFVNPLLVDMGVTGFGLAGRRLRERLIDTLTGVYYLRTLPWGALTRQWPSSYTVWQEDSDVEGGYKCIANCNNRLPSNPEVLDIYEMANNPNGVDGQSTSGGGFLDQLGDFVNGMMRL